MSDPYGHTEDTLPGPEELFGTRCSASAEEVRDALNDSLGVGVRRERYEPPGDLPDVGALRAQLFEEA